jgi:hypothetical protein
VKQRGPPVFHVKQWGVHAFPEEMVGLWEFRRFDLKPKMNIMNFTFACL